MDDISNSTYLDVLKKDRERQVRLELLRRQIEQILTATIFQAYLKSGGAIDQLSPKAPTDLDLELEPRSQTQRK